jgi:N-acetylmuramoyl-L-alanine amidase CwlA
MYYRRALPVATKMIYQYNKENKNGDAGLYADICLNGNADKYQDFVVTVLTEEMNNGLRLVLNAHESNVFIKHDLPIGAGTPNYYSDIFGSVSKLLYNQELEIDYKYNQRTNDKYGSNLSSRRMKSIEFITVHYTAGFSPSADADAHGEWFSQPVSENNTSIHYSTGNDGVFKGLDEQYRAAHAGDDKSRETVSEFSWIDTPVEVLDTDPEFPVVTITSNATFAINGRDTGVKVPREIKYNRGFVTDSKWLNDQGIAVNIKDGKYQLGTCWWCYSQVGEGRICSNGGNRNSIGIESAVNKGSDLWYTWQITAQLVADIMERHQLDITRVKGHHFFSAKDCPQPMLENDMEIWWEFIELVRAEYEKISTCVNYEFEFECDSDLVNEHGRVTGQKNTSQVVTYQVTITKNGTSQTVELASIIEGIYNK